MYQYGILLFADQITSCILEPSVHLFALNRCPIINHPYVWCCLCVVCRTRYVRSRDTVWLHADVLQQLHTSDHRVWQWAPLPLWRRWECDLVRQSSGTQFVSFHIISQCKIPCTCVANYRWHCVFVQCSFHLNCVMIPIKSFNRTTLLVGLCSL